MTILGSRVLRFKDSWDVVLEKSWGFGLNRWGKKLACGAGEKKTKFVREMPWKSLFFFTLFERRAETLIILPP